MFNMSHLTRLRKWAFCRVHTGHINQGNMPCVYTVDERGSRSENLISSAYYFGSLPWPVSPVLKVYRVNMPFVFQSNSRVVNTARQVVKSCWWWMHGTAFVIANIGPTLRSTLNNRCKSNSIDRTPIRDGTPA